MAYPEDGMGDYGEVRRMGYCGSKILGSRLQRRWSAESPAKPTTTTTTCVAEAFETQERYRLLKRPCILFWQRLN